MDNNHLTIKTFMTITAERDAAIRERNMALEERKRAFAERDMAMLQRDAAIAERNAAIKERDDAIFSLRFRESSMNDNKSTPDSLGNELVSGDKQLEYQYQHQMHVTEAVCRPRESFADTGAGVMKPSEIAKRKKERPLRDGKGTKSTNSASSGKRTADGLSKQMNSGLSASLNIDQNVDSDEDIGKKVSWKDNLGLNQINFDESSMPVPVCTCTGSPQPCYRWGSGGWQSACCTTTISMYPLPQMANKRYTRVGGRKMSGGAFGKLLNRLAAEGYDFSTPLDLKNHWAKHGTNRYSTLK